MQCVVERARPPVNGPMIYGYSSYDMRMRLLDSRGMLWLSPCLAGYAWVLRAATRSRRGWVAIVSIVGVTTVHDMRREGDPESEDYV